MILGIYISFLNHKNSSFAVVILFKGYPEVQSPSAVQKVLHSISALSTDCTIGTPFCFFSPIQALHFIPASGFFFNAGNPPNNVAGSHLMDGPFPRL